jgi:hypothetical protein
MPIKTTTHLTTLCENTTEISSYIFQELVLDQHHQQQHFKAFKLNFLDDAIFML